MIVEKTLRGDILPQPPFEDDDEDEDEIDSNSDGRLNCITDGTTETQPRERLDSRQEALLVPSFLSGPMRTTRAGRTVRTETVTSRIARPLVKAKFLKALV